LSLLGVYLLQQLRWPFVLHRKLANYLAENLSDLGITQGRVIVTKDLATMMGYLESGQVDLYFDSPFPALEVYENIGAQPLVRRWKGGVSEYHSLIVAHKNSGITNLEELSGKTIVFDHPASTSGYLLPKSHLVINGFETIEIEETESAIPADQIGYIFAFGEENQIRWLLDNKVSAAGISNGDYEYLSLEQREQLTILAQTPNVPRHIALASPNMNSELKESIVQLLLEIDETPEGKEILDIFEGTSQFDELPDGPEGMMKALKDLFAPVR
jgi:phosphonate transport system substrate-binding protein